VRVPIRRDLAGHPASSLGFVNEFFGPVITSQQFETLVAR